MGAKIVRTVISQIWLALADHSAPSPRSNFYASLKDSPQVHVRTFDKRDHKLETGDSRPVSIPMQGRSVETQPYGDQKIPIDEKFVPARS